MRRGRAFLSPLTSLNIPDTERDSAARRKLRSVSLAQFPSSRTLHAGSEKKRWRPPSPCERTEAGREQAAGRFDFVVGLQYSIIPPPPAGPGGATHLPRLIRPRGSSSIVDLSPLVIGDASGADSWTRVWGGNDDDVYYHPRLRVCVL